MNYRIEPGLPVEAQLRSIFADQVKIAVNGLKKYPDYDADGLHSARKCLKRLRALLRLMQKKKFRHAQKTYNDKLRKMGFALSPYRDREVIASLLSPYREESEQKEAVPEAVDPDVEKSVLWELVALSNTFQRSAIPVFTVEHLKKGMDTCREIMIAAYKQYAITQSHVHLHEFRKRVKDHAYHMQLMEAFYSHYMTYRMHVRELEDLLGDARDCDLVTEYLNGSPDLPIQPASEARVNFILTRDRIMKEAVKLAESVIKEKPLSEGIKKPRPESGL